MNHYIAAIDIGTTGTKSCIFDTAGNLLSSAYQEYPSYYPAHGYVEQDIGQVCDAVFSTCYEAVSKSGVHNSDILAVTVSTQGTVNVLVDQNGSVVRDRIIGWQDLRHLEVLDEIKEKISEEEVYAINGAGIGSFNTAANIWVQKNEPKLWRKVGHLCSHQDFFLKLLGADGYYTDIATAHRMSVYDVDHNCWNQKLMDVYGFSEKILPKVVQEPGKVVGTVKDDIAERTGLPAGCKICMGSVDLNASSFGTGAVNSDVAVMVVGTFGGSYITVDKPVRDPSRTIVIKGYHGMGRYQLEAFSHTAASAFRWFRDSLCPLEVATSKLMGVDPYSLMTEIAEKSVPGSNGVTALTCLQGSHGRRINENIRGTFLGIMLGTEKSDLAHAVLEGICYEMYDILLMQEKFSKPVKAIRLSGGVSKSPMWCQMFADVMGRPVELTKVKETAALGAAMYAGVGLGIYDNCEKAVERCVRIEERYEPDMGNHRKYMEAFKRWNEAFDVLNGTFYTKS